MKNDIQRAAQQNCKAINLELFRVKFALRKANQSKGRL